MREDTSGPAVGVYHCLLDEHVIAQTWKDYGPDEPVDRAQTENCQAHHTVEVVWQGLVHALAFVWGHIRCNSQVDV